MIYLSILGKNVNVIRGSITYNLNEVSTFNVSIHLQGFDYNSLLGAAVQLWDREDLYLIGGHVVSRPNLIFEDGKAVVELSCEDEFGELTRHYARRQSKYQHVWIRDIVNGFLTIVGGWSLVNTTVNSDNYAVTIDLRSKETIFAQIAESCNSIEDVVFYNTSTAVSKIFRLSTVGEILSSSLFIDAIQGHNLLNLEIEPQNKPNYNIITAYSGLSGVPPNGKRIKLNRAAGTTMYTASPYFSRYKIFNNAVDNSWYCEDITPPPGINRGVRKSFEYIKFGNDVAPTSAQLDQVSYSLYLKCVRFMKESEPSNIYKIKGVFNGMPRVGRLVNLYAKIDEPVLPAHFEQMGSPNNTIYEIQGSFVITSVTANLEEFEIYDEVRNKKYIAEITATDGKDYHSFGDLTRMIENIDNQFTDDMALIE